MTALIVSDNLGKPMQSYQSDAIYLAVRLFRTLGLGVYCTCLKTSRQEEQYANKYGVQLLYPEPIGLHKYTKPNNEWFNFHELCFPHLSKINDVRIVLGFSITTSGAALEIRDALFPRAILLFGNVLKLGDTFLQTKLCLSIEEINQQKSQLIKDLIQADGLLSFGYPVFESFNKLLTNYSDHFSFHTFPDQRYFMKSCYAYVGGYLHIVSMRHVLFSINALSYKDIDFNWKILDVPCTEEDIILEKIKLLPNQKVTLFTELDDIDDELISSHLVIITSQTSLQFALNVMAMGIPTLVQSDCYPCIETLSDNLQSVVYNNESDDESLTELIQDVYGNYSKYTDIASKIKQDLQRVFQDSTYRGNDDIYNMLEYKTGLTRSSQDYFKKDIGRDESIILRKSREEGDISVHIHIKGIPEKDVTMTEVEKRLHESAVLLKLPISHEDIVFRHRLGPPLTFVLYCNTFKSLRYLWEQYQTTKIQERIKSNVFTSENMKHIGAVYLDLRCYINFKEYELCKKEIKLKAEIETQTDQTIYFKQEQQDVKQWGHSKDWSPEYISAMKLEPDIAFEDRRGTVKPLSYEEAQTIAEYLVKPETSSEDSAVFKQIPELKKHVFGIATNTNTDMGPMFRKGKRMLRTSPDLNLPTKQTIGDEGGFKWEEMVSPAHVTSQATSSTVSPVLYEQETEPQVYQTDHIKQEQQEFKQCEHWSPEDSSAIKHEPGIAFEETRRTVKPLRYEDAQNMAEYLVKPETSSEDSAVFKQIPGTNTDMGPMFRKGKRMLRTSPDLNLPTKQKIGDEGGFKWEEMVSPAHVTSQAASASVSPVLFEQETGPPVYQTVDIKQEQQQFKQCEYWSPEDSSAMKHEPGMAFEETRRTVKPLKYEDAQNMAEYIVKRETSSKDSAMKTENMESLNYEVKKQSVDTLKLEFKNSPDTDMDSMFQKLKRMRRTDPDFNLPTKHRIEDESGFKWEEMLAPAHVTSQATSARTYPVLYKPEIGVQDDTSDGIQVEDKLFQAEQNKKRKKAAPEVQDIPEDASFDDLVDILDKEINNGSFRLIRRQCISLLKDRHIRLPKPETVKDLFIGLRHLGIIDNDNITYRDAVRLPTKPRLDRLIESIGEKIRTDAAGMVEESATVFSQETRYFLTITRVKTIGDKGSQPGSFNTPIGITTNDKGELVVADYNNDRVQILDWKGHCRVCLSFNSFAKPFKPHDVAVSRDGKYFIIDDSNKQIVVCREDNTIITTFSLNRLYNPRSIALTKDGYVLVANWSRDCLSKYTVYGIHIADLGERGDGACQFLFPQSVVVNSKNHIIVSDSDNNRIQVFDSQFRFLYSCGGSKDNQLSYPYGVDLDSQDNIYVCDTDNNRITKYSHGGRFICHIDQGLGQVSSPERIVLSEEYPMKIAIKEFCKNTVKILYLGW